MRARNSQGRGQNTSLEAACAVHRGLRGRGRPLVCEERGPGRQVRFLFRAVQRSRDGPRACSGGPPRGRDGGRPGGLAARDHGGRMRTCCAPFRASEVWRSRGESGSAKSGAEVLYQNGLARRSLAAAVLFYPTYFDSRFLLPIWPVLAVGIGLSLFSAANGLAAIPRIAIGVGLAGSLLLASISVVREPNFATYWGTTELIDELVNRYGVSNLVNVGNCEAWNVCKTGLMNELREKPGSCFVLHDLTRAGEGRAERLLEQADAVVVLGRSDLSEAVMQVVPGLNRGYGAAVENLGRNPAFRQVPLQTTRGLPVVSVFVRRTEFGQAGESSKSEPRRRR